MAWNDDSWRDSYDAWKLATPPEYDGPDEKIEDEDWLIFEEQFVWFLEEENERQRQAV